MAHRVRNILAPPLAAGALLMAAPSGAGASAAGYEYWGGFTANIGGQNVGIPGGQLHHQIDGEGARVNWQGANFVSAGNLCDPSMRFTYDDGSSIDGDVHWGCSHVGQWKYTIEADKPRGSSCAELWTENWERIVARQCHYIEG